MNRLKDWFLLFRPWSYTATLVPFLVGGAVAIGAYPRCEHAFMRWLLGLFAGLLFQATVNLLNTWGDERSGVDAVPGAIRTTPQVHEGKVSMHAILSVAACCLVLAVAIGVSLCFYREEIRPEHLGNWEFCTSLLAAGIVGALGSINYSTGIKFKYRGLGVPFVSFLMGPLEIFVAFAIAAPNEADGLLCELLDSFKCIVHLGSGGMSPLKLAIFLGMLILVMLPVALLVGAIMHGNDMRDISTDRAAGIVTLASWLGPRRALGYYCFCHVAPYVVVIALCAMHFIFLRVNGGAWLLLPCLALPLSVRTMRRAVGVYRENPASPAWCGLERGTGLVHLVFGVLYAAALFIVA